MLREHILCVALRFEIILKEKMTRCFKWILLMLLFIGSKSGFSETTSMNIGTLSFASSDVYSFQHTTPNPGFPSHGFAMIILRYNETGKSKVFVIYKSAHYIFIGNIERSTKTRITSVYANCSLIFPPKLGCSEAFFRSLPLRSPPYLRY